MRLLYCLTPEHFLKIRSITVGTSPEAGLQVAIEQAGAWLRRLAAAFGQAGFEVQTTRLSLPPVAHLVRRPSELAGLTGAVDRLASDAGVGYAALGPLRWSDRPDDPDDYAKSLGESLADTERVFGSIETADAEQVCFPAVRSAARVVELLARSTEQGFGNLRFAALANCPPGIPFFPAAYHLGESPTFSLALQAADLVVRSFEQAASLEQAERALTAAVEQRLAELEQVALPLERELGLRYAGADPTPAPFPDDAESIGAAFERLGVSRFGRAGTLTAAALVTRALRAVRGRRCGFAGVMLPVLEDTVLARSASEGLYSWEELMLYSSVCGTGLDTVPLPGDISTDELASIILDVSTLAVTLRKPLTCRLIPVPGKRAGERTTFDFPFFANGAVLRSKGGGSPELLRRGQVSPRP
jgi:uncharacterized protein